MKKILKITSILNIIYGIHYLAIGVLALLVTGFTAIVSIATFSFSLIGGTIGMILYLALCIALAYFYGFGGIYALKGNKKKALINSAITAIIAIIFLIISLASKKVHTSFLDVFAVVLPIVHGYLIIQTED